MRISISIQQDDDGALAGTVTVTDWRGDTTTQRVHVGGMAHAGLPGRIGEAALLQRAANAIYFRVMNVVRGEVKAAAHDTETETA